MLMRVRSECRACTRSSSRSHARIATSPAKLLIASREPRAAGTVWSVCGARGGRSCAKAGAPRIAIRTVQAARIASGSEVRNRCGLPKQRELALPRLRQVAVQVRVRGILLDGAVRLLDGAIDGRNARFEDPHGFGIQPRAARLQGLL